MVVMLFVTAMMITIMVMLLGTWGSGLIGVVGRSYFDSSGGPSRVAWWSISNCLERSFWIVWDSF